MKTGSQKLIGALKHDKTKRVDITLLLNKNRSPFPMEIHKVPQIFQTLRPFMVVTILEFCILMVSESWRRYSGGQLSKALINFWKRWSMGCRHPFVFKRREVLRPLWPSFFNFKSSQVLLRACFHSQVHSWSYDRPKIGMLFCNSCATKFSGLRLAKV